MAKSKKKPAQAAKPQAQQVKVQQPKVVHVKARDASTDFMPNQPIHKPPMTKLNTRALSATQKDYYDSLRNPFGRRGTKSPNSGNTAATVSTFTATTVVSESNLSVANNTAVQLTFFPGHGAETGNSNPTCWFGKQQHVGTTPTPYCIGPMDTNTGVQSCSLLKGVTTNDLTIWSTNTAATTAMVWDQGVPMTCSIDSSGHTRWRLVSCGIRITNTTPLVNRGGSIVSVRPETRHDYSSSLTQRAFAMFPTYRVDGVAKTLEILWVPRTEDFGFWSVASLFATNPKEGGMFVWINNATGFAQSYNYETVWNWEVAGASVRPLLSLSITEQAHSDFNQRLLALAHEHSIAPSRLHEAAEHLANFMRGATGSTAKLESLFGTALKAISI
jgi:hypothetical protein